MVALPQQSNAVLVLVLGCWQWRDLQYLTWMTSVRPPLPHGVRTLTQNVQGPTLRAASAAGILWPQISVPYIAPNSEPLPRTVASSGQGPLVRAVHAHDQAAVPQGTPCCPHKQRMASRLLRLRPTHGRTSGQTGQSVSSPPGNGLAASARGHVPSTHAHALLRIKWSATCQCQAHSYVVPLHSAPATAPLRTAIV